jgi:hypothetical protein
MCLGLKHDYILVFFFFCIVKLIRHAYETDSLFKIQIKIKYKNKNFFNNKQIKVITNSLFFFLILNFRLIFYVYLNFTKHSL